MKSSASLRIYDNIGIVYFEAHITHDQSWENITTHERLRIRGCTPIAGGRSLGYGVHHYLERRPTEPAGKYAMGSVQQGGGDVVVKCEQLYHFPITIYSRPCCKIYPAISCTQSCRL
jgi:hypothetical protein